MEELRKAEPTAIRNLKELCFFKMIRELSLKVKLVESYELSIEILGN
jgi:hypothetical protein